MKSSRSLSHIRHFVFDLDGTLHLGPYFFPATTPLFDWLDESKIGYTLLTNNSSYSREELLCKFHRWGLSLETEQVMTSVHAALEYLRLKFPPRPHLFVLGTAGMCNDLEDGGAVLDDTNPDAVIVGLDTTLTYERLCRAAWFISNGVPFLATHPDVVCPLPGQTLAVDCGAICAMLKAATGKAPIILGKPHPTPIRNLGRRLGLESQEIAIVGDRLSTDIALAHNSGATGVLVLTGDATREQAKTSTWKPHVILQDLNELLRVLKFGARH